MSLFNKAFSMVRDPRNNINIKYELLDILFITFAGILSGAEGWSEIYEFASTKQEWIRRYRPYKEGIPSEDTIARVIKAIEPKSLNESFIAWVNTIRQVNNQPQIALDGKTLKLSKDGEKHNALHSITAWCNESGLILSQLKSTGQKNEHAGILEILDMLNIKDSIITVDAMNSQKKIANKIIDKQADYIFCIKSNHKIFQEEIQAYFHKIKRDKPHIIEIYQDTDAGHGRIETRICEVLTVDEWLESAREWKNIKKVIRLERLRIDKATLKESKEEIFYISSLDRTAEHISHCIRQHWGVENNAHWVLDVVYKEDDCRIRKEHGAENIATIRRLCLNVAKLYPSKVSMKAKLKKAGWDDSFRDELLFGANLS